MANKKISELTALGTAPADGDLFPIVDVSDPTDAASGTTKKVTTQELLTNTYKPGGTDVAIADGGTGQSTTTAAFDALAPTTTQGDIIYHNGTNNVRLAKGTAGQLLRMNTGATAPEWGSALSSISSQVSVGQTMNGTTTPVPVFLSEGGTETILSYNQTGTDNLTTEFGYDTASHGTKVAKKFTTASGMTLLFNKVIARLSASGGGASVSVIASIQADSAGTPSGTDLIASGAVSVSGAAASHTFTFGSILELSASTTYWIVLTASSPAGTGGEVIGDTTGGSSTYAVYQGGSWTVNANYAPRISVTMDYTSGKFYVSDSDLTTTKVNDGFILNSVAKDASTGLFIPVYCGLVLGGFSGLTAGTIYYTGVNGAITTSSGSAVKVGKAISTTEIILSNSLS